MWLKYAMAKARLMSGLFGLEMARNIEKKFPNFIDSVWVLGSPATMLTVKSYEEQEGQYTPEEDEEIKDIDILIKLSVPWHKIPIDNRYSLLNYIKDRRIDFGTSYERQEELYWDIFILNTNNKIMVFDPDIMHKNKIEPQHLNWPKPENRPDWSYDDNLGLLRDTTRFAPYTPPFRHGWKMIGIRIEPRIDPRTGDIINTVSEPKVVYNRWINRSPNSDPIPEKDPDTQQILYQSSNDIEILLKEIYKRGKYLYGLTDDEIRDKQKKVLKQLVKNDNDAAAWALEDFI